MHSNLDSLRQETENHSQHVIVNTFVGECCRVNLDDETGHIMSREHTKHMTEKDLHRNVPTVRDIRTVLLHFSPVTPNQQLKQSFQTLPLTRQIQTALHDELSFGSDQE